MVAIDTGNVQRRDADNDEIDSMPLDGFYPLSFITFNVQITSFSLICHTLAEVNLLFCECQLK